MHKHTVNTNPTAPAAPSTGPDIGRGAAPGSLAAALAGVRRPRPAPGVEDLAPDEETRPGQ